MAYQEVGVLQKTARQSMHLQGVRAAVRSGETATVRPSPAPAAHQLPAIFKYQYSTERRARDGQTNSFMANCGLCCRLVYESRTLYDD